MGEVITLVYTSVSEEVTHGDRKKETGGGLARPRPGGFAQILTPSLTADHNRALEKPVRGPGQEPSCTSCHLHPEHGVFTKIFKFLFSDFFSLH